MIPLLPTEAALMTPAQAAPICPHCFAPAVFANLRDVFGPRFPDSPAWTCRGCEAWAFADPDGTPIGPVADRQLRRFRSRLIDRFFDLAAHIRDRQGLYAGLKAARGRAETRLQAFDMNDCMELKRYLLDVEQRYGIHRGKDHHE